MTSFLLNLSSGRLKSTTKSADVTQLAEYGPSKSEVVGSNPIVRSQFFSYDRGHVHLTQSHDNWVFLFSSRLSLSW